MDKINSWIGIFLIFFLVSGSLVAIFTDVAVKNENLDSESLEKISNLQSYDEIEREQRFGDNQSINYSLTGYENSDPFAQSNQEARGFTIEFLFFADLILIVPLMLSILLPFIPFNSFGWALTIIIGALGYYFILAIINLWKK